MPTLAGFVVDSAGAAVSAGVTVNIYARNTTTPVVQSPSVNASGYWQTSALAEGRYDSEVTYGTTVRRIKYDSEVQFERGEFKTLQVRGGDNAFAYTLAGANIAAARTLNLPLITATDTLAALGLAQVFTAGPTWRSATAATAAGTIENTNDAASVLTAIFQGDRATPADTDLAYISLRLSDSAGNQDEQARIGWSATTVADGATQDGDLILSALVNNTLTEMLRLDGSASEIDVAVDVDYVAAAVRWSSGVAVVAGEYSIQRDADATNQLHANVPTGATFEWSVNDVAQMTLSATAVDFLDNSITTTGGGSLTGTWTDLGTVTTVDINGGTIDSVTVNSSFTWTAAQNFGANNVYINDTANANMTVGLTINQGAADNHVFAVKSSDVAHGMTDAAETDTYASMEKWGGTDGGLRLRGFSAVTSGLVLDAAHTTDNTAKTTSAAGAIQVIGRLRSGTTTTTLGADANILVIANGATSRFIFDAEGSGHADIEFVAFDSYDDLLALDQLQVIAGGSAPRLTPERYGGNPLAYNRERFEEMGIVGRGSWHIENGRQRQMVNFTKLAMLHHGSILQLADRTLTVEDRVKLLEIENGSLRQQIAALKAA